MTDLVVDSNTIVKWFVDEEFSGDARRVLNMGVNLVAPDFMPAEVTSALLKKYRQRQIARADILTARAGIRDAFELVDSEPLLDEALTLAIPFARSSYDSIYVVVAHNRGCQIVTADRRLYEALSPVLPETLLWVEDIPE